MPPTRVHIEKYARYF